MSPAGDRPRGVVMLKGSSFEGFGIFLNRREVRDIGRKGDGGEEQCNDTCWRSLNQKGKIHNGEQRV